MEVYVLSFILCIGITLETSFSLLCPESIPTVSMVSHCPANVKEWASAAERKSCGQLRKIQNCSKAEDFVYHCVLNKDATQLLEVCAPRFFLMGLCARFSEVNKRIINEPGLDCTKFDPPCPARFPSNESYKYQTCYRNVGKSQQQKEPLHESTLFILYVAVGIAGVIILTSLILLLLGFKLNWIKCTCKRSSEEETVPDTLFDYTKVNLQGSLHPGLNCPVCGRSWSIYELVVYCNMSEDEKNFFLRVAHLNERNARELQLHGHIDRIDALYVQEEDAENPEDASGQGATLIP